MDYPRHTQTTLRVEYLEEQQQSHKPEHISGPALFPFPLCKASPSDSAHAPTLHHHQLSADHVATSTSTRCSLQVAKGQGLQNAPARGGKTHCPSATKDQFYLRICVPMTSYVSAARGSIGILAEPQEVARLQNTDCPHSSEGLWCFPTGHRFSSCLKCVTHAGTIPWSCCSTCVLLCAWWPSPSKAGSWPTSSFFSGILRSSLGLNASIFLFMPWSGTDYSNEHRKNECR